MPLLLIEEGEIVQFKPVKQRIELYIQFQLVREPLAVFKREVAFPIDQSQGIGIILVLSSLGMSVIHFHILQSTVFLNEPKRLIGRTTASYGKAAYITKCAPTDAMVRLRAYKFMKG